MAHAKRARARRRQRKLKAAMREGSVAIKRRDPNALAACLRNGAGRHTDRKKEASRKACRKPVGFLLCEHLVADAVFTAATGGQDHRRHQAI